MRRSSAWLNAALVALALATALAVWFTRQTPTTAEVESRRARLFTQYGRDRVERLTLTRDGARLVLVRTESASGAGHGGETAHEEPATPFRIAEPWQEPADASGVSGLLASLDLATALREANGVSRGAAGLDKPRFELVVSQPGARTVLRVGAPAPTPPGARYASVTVGEAPERVVVLSGSLISELDLPLDRFREPGFVSLGKSDLRAVEVEGPGVHHRLEQPAPGDFRVVAGGRSELADADAVAAFFTALSRLSSETFIELAAARAALESPLKLTLTALEPARAEETLLVGGSCPNGAGAVLVREKPSPRAGCVAADIARALATGTDALRLARVSAARRDEVEELSLRLGSRTLELARKGSGYVLKSPSASDVSLEAGDRFLDALLGARGELVPMAELGPLQLDPPEGELSLWRSRVGSEGRVLERILLGKRLQDGRTCVRRELDGAALCFTADEAVAFEPDARRLRSPSVLAFAPSALTSLQITRSSEQQRLERSAEGGYRLVEPPGFAHDGELVADAVQTLSALRAERWVADRDEGGYGLTSPELRIDVQLRPTDADARHVTLLVGKATRGGAFAKLAEDPAVFVIGRSALEDVDGLLIDRSLCPFSPDAVASIEIRNGAVTLRLDRRARDEWVTAGSAPTAIDTAGLAELATSLRAERALHLGPARPEEELSTPRSSVTFTDKSGAMRRLNLGARARYRDLDANFARLDGVDATFVVAQATLAPLLAP